MNYVIGDVHGCLDELHILLEKIESRDPDPTIYFVGDWIDRGPKVPATIQWVVDNISLEGRYRSVRGNHDQEAYDWFNYQYIPWYEHIHNGQDDPPETYYDFAERVKTDFDYDPEKIRSFMDTVKNKMDYNKRIDTVSEGGVPVTYRLCHAWHSYDESMDHNERAQINLYMRDYWGNRFNDEIILHGHTPTIVADYQYRCPLDENRPGMIGYRHNAINVDGGCCFFRKGYSMYPCMLCAICLETFEEIYPYSVEERFLEAARISAMNHIERFPDVEVEDLAKELCKDSVEEYRRIRESRYRIDMMERLGLS